MSSPDEFPGEAPFGLGMGVVAIGWVGFISWCITFSVCCLNTLCYAGLIALPALIQMGLCLVWVYGIIRNMDLSTKIIGRWGVRAGGKNQWTTLMKSACALGP